MGIHWFVVIVSGVDHTIPDFETRFHKAGCDDATISVCEGVVRLDFARVADSREEAILSAGADVMRAGGRIERIEKAVGLPPISRAA